MGLNLIIQEIKPIYSCLEFELYPLGIRMSNACKDNIIDFGDFSTSFTTQYCDDVKQMFIDAEKLPDAIIRSSEHAESRVLILPQAKICIGLAKKLKFHIKKAWAKELWKIKFNDAGFASYRKATNENWEVLIIMISNMKIFITNNSAALIAKGMPATFETDFNTQFIALRPLINTFIEAENEAISKRNTKITANNAACTELKLIAEAGKIIYSENPSKRGLFTISKQLELISGAGSHWRNFTIEANGFKTVEKIVRNSYFKNTGDVAIILCEGNTKCTTGITVEPGQTIKLEFEGTIITVNNTSADKKAKFMCRCMKG